MEMVVKGGHIADFSYDPRQSERFHKPSFKFDHYDAFSPDADAMITCSYNGPVGESSPAAFDRCKSELRAAGITVSSAFTSLAMKTLVILLEASGDAARARASGSDNLYSACGIDMRQLGRERKACVSMPDMNMSWPIVGHYTSGCVTGYTIDEALEMPLVDLAKRMMVTTSRLRSDTSFRLQEVEAQWSLPNDDSFLVEALKSVIFGTSSVNLKVPSALWWFGVDDLNSVPYIVFGPAAHLWFNVITFKDSTTVTAQVRLPLMGAHDDAELQRAIVDAARGSPLEMLIHQN